MSLKVHKQSSNHGGSSRFSKTANRLLYSIQERSHHRYGRIKRVKNFSPFLNLLSLLRQSHYFIGRGVYRSRLVIMPDQQTMFFDRQIELDCELGYAYDGLLRLKTAMDQGHLYRSPNRSNFFTRGH